MNGSQKSGPYFFEVFTLANFVVLLVALRRVTLLPLTTLSSVIPAIAFGFVVQALVGIAIRLAFAVRRGGVRDLLDVYRSKGWILDTLRLAIASGFWVHTYGWIKLTVPVLHPHLIAGQLWNLDRALCFGYSPTVFLLTVFGQPWMLRFIDWTYAYFFFASVNIVAIWFASAPDRRLRIAFMNSNALLWLCGAWLYVAVPTLGPAYRFPEVWLPLAPLLERTQAYQRMLMSNYHALHDSLNGHPRPINILFGIAAFPSLHVGFQTLAYLWMRKVTVWGGPVFIVMALFILIGSMVTGWHYLVDGLAGAALAWACYEAAQRVPAIRA